MAGGQSCKGTAEALPRTCLQLTDAGHITDQNTCAIIAPKYKHLASA